MWDPPELAAPDKCVKEGIMDITHRRINRVDVLGLSGRMMAPEAAVLKEQLDQLFAEGRYRIILDLSQLEYISSGGLRILIEARKRAQDARPSDGGHGGVVLAYPTQRIRDVLALTGFINYFQMYDDMAEAVGSF
jgi:anti-sigma B factor antagonist